MSRRWMHAVAGAGLLPVVWVAWGFVGSSPLALATTGLIALVYLAGVAELVQASRLLGRVQRALHTQGEGDDDLLVWLARLPVSWQEPMRLRVQGQRVAWPAPMLTPYLVGLLVMLGMLGTFLGMVVTFKGAVFALEGSSNLEAIRSALSAPIRGLSLSFGTSVAGVAASAALGFCAALYRRERAEVLRQVDPLIDQRFRLHTPRHRQDALWQAMSAQAAALPEMVVQLAAVAQGLNDRQETLHTQMLARHDAFQTDAARAYTALTDRLATLLNQHLSDHMTTLQQRIQPVVAEAMAGLLASARQSQQELATSLSRYASELAAQWSDQSAQSVRQASQTWAELTRVQAEAQMAMVQRLDDALQRFNQLFEAQAAQLMDRAEAQAEAREHAEAVWDQRHRQHWDQAEQHQAHLAQAALQRLDGLHATVAQHIGQLGAALEAPLNRMLLTASEVPKTAAALMQRWESEQRAQSERELNAETQRQHLLERLQGVLMAVEQMLTEQRRTSQAWMAQSTEALQAASVRLGDGLAVQLNHAQTISARLQASAVELASLGEAFAHGVQQFSASNVELSQGLGRVEEAIHQSLTRSDDQLVYYVAQAREVIDLSVSAQQALLEQLRQLRSVGPLTPSGGDAGASA